MVDCVEKSGAKVYQEDKMWLSWLSRKTLSSLAPTDTPKLQLFTEQLSMGMIWRLAEKIFPWPKTWRKNHNEKRRLSTVKTSKPRLMTHEEEVTVSVGFPPGSEGSEPHIMARQRDEPPEHLTLKARRSWHLEEPKGYGKHRLQSQRVHAKSRAIWVPFERSLGPPACWSWRAMSPPISGPKTTQ